MPRKRGTRTSRDTREREETREREREEHDSEEEITLPLSYVKSLYDLAGAATLIVSEGMTVENVEDLQDAIDDADSEEDDMDDDLMHQIDPGYNK